MGANSFYINVRIWFWHPPNVNGEFLDKTWFEWNCVFFKGFLSCEGVHWLVFGLPAVVERWLNTSWCTIVVETSRVWKGSSGFPALWRVFTQHRPAQLLLLLLSPLQSSWAPLWIQFWSKLERAPNLLRSRTCWETSFIPIWIISWMKSPNTMKMHMKHKIKCTERLSVSFFLYNRKPPIKSSVRQPRLDVGLQIDGAFNSF